MTSTEWFAKAACKGLHVDLFHPKPNHRSITPNRDEQTAIAVCNGCPVKAECLQYAHDTHTTAGVWGGMTETQRNTTHPEPRKRYGGTQRQPVNCGTPAGAIAHRKRGQQPCTPCRTARNLYRQQRRQTLGNHNAA